MPPPSAQSASSIAAARAAIDRGDLIATYDFASAALDEGADGAAFLLVLSLARMGDTAAARKRYVELGLDRATDIDTRALGARLDKNAAEKLSGDARQRCFAAAAAAYAAIYADTGAAFPGINAASLSLLAGNDRDARVRAAELLTLSFSDDFWCAASRAEAMLVLGRDAEARAEIGRAVTLPGSNLGARATTLRQFNLLARFAGCDPDGTVRALLAPPATTFYCGHMFVAGGGGEAALTARIDAALDANAIGVGFGALACGSDILIAERLLARGGELNVVLPFAAPEFIKLSVDPGGSAWRERFDACLAAATTVRIVSDICDLGDPHAISYASTISMGLARLRANELHGVATILAIWDGAAARGAAGTAVDIARWRSTERPAVILRTTDLNRQLDTADIRPYAGPPRAVVAMIFADAPGFSKLAEAEIPRFWRDVMGTIGQVLDHHGVVVRSRNSWGDAIFAVIDGVAAAAEIVMTIQERLDRAGVLIGLRVGGHLGPVFETADPVTGQPTFYGREVSRTARIEPVTPPGQVYVTEAFAAAIAMDAPDLFECRYVGQVSLAKDFGVFPMYQLSRSAQ